ncbi:helix-turn-helix domain-containing protein [Mycobacterium sp. BMJ-28]
MNAVTFANQLNRLFATVYPPDRGPYTGREVSYALHKRGADVSQPYLSQLRSGQRNQPSHRVVVELADFFGVRPAYFTGEDPDYTRTLDAELRWLELARNPTVRHLTTALLELAPHVRAAALEAVS